MRQEKVCLDGLSLIKVCMIKWQNEFVRVLDQQIKIKKKIKSFLAWQERYDEKGSSQVWQGKYICATMHK